MDRQFLIHQVDQAPVQVGQTATDIDDDHETDQRIALGQVAGQHLAPVLAQLGRHLGVAVAGEIDQPVVLVDGEEVDELGATGRLAGLAQVLLSAQAVDGGGLAGVGTAGEGDLATLVGQQLGARTDTRNRQPIQESL